MKIAVLLDGRQNLRDIFKLINRINPSGTAMEEDSFFSLLRRLDNIYAVKWEAGHKAAQNYHSPARALPAEQNIVSPANHLSAPLCTHCLSSSGKSFPGELKLPEVKNIIDQLAAMKVFTITFCGGEPLVRKDIYEILQYATQYKMGLKLSTNGVLLTDVVLKKMDSVNIFGVQVSLDGTEHTHDKFRNQPGAYHKTVVAIKRLTDAGYYTVVAPVLTRVNIQDMDYVLETAIRLGASTFKPSLFLPSGRGKKNISSLLLSKAELKHYMKHLANLQKQYQDSIKIELAGMYPGLQPTDCEITEIHHNGNFWVGCPAGTTQIVITATGKVVPCSFLYDFVAGDLRKENLRTIWHHSRVLESFRKMEQHDLKGKCRDCKHVPQKCLGGCRAAAYLYSGDIYAEDPLCWN
jgi:radical SAM protein with 4Fe4S-binding SPASM domain